MFNIVSIIHAVNGPHFKTGFETSDKPLHEPYTHSEYTSSLCSCVLN